MTRLLLVLALALALGACGSTGTAGTPAATTGPAAATTGAPTATTVSERLAHWREVVAPMGCAELATLEQRRLAIQFNDQAESLIAIHDRQAKLHCPQ
jgi:glycerol uptake facilitator-like aquaporin